MDHAISSLKDYMMSTIDMWEGISTKEEIKEEIRAYVEAINRLEIYYYGEERTSLDVILYLAEKGC